MLNIQNLTVTLGGNRILDGLNLSLPAVEAQKLIEVSLEGSVG